MSLSDFVGRLEQRYPYELLRYLLTAIQLILLSVLVVLLARRPWRAQQLLTGAAT